MGTADFLLWWMAPASVPSADNITHFSVMYSAKMDLLLLGKIVVVNCFGVLLS